MGLTPRVAPRFKTVPTLLNGEFVEGRENSSAAYNPTVEEEAKRKATEEAEKSKMPAPRVAGAGEKPAGSGGSMGGSEGYFDKMRQKHATALDYAKQALSAQQQAEGGGAEEEEETDVMKTWNSANQIERLTKQGSNFFNLDPFGVLQLRSDCNIQQVKKHFRKLSLLVHPDKNLQDERAKAAFEAVKKAYQCLDSEEKFMESARIVTEAIKRVEEEEKDNKKKIKKTGRPYTFPSQEQLELAVQVMRTKLYGEMENRRRNMECRESNENARKHQMEMDAKEKNSKKQKIEKEWEKTRDVRMASWQDFLNGKAGKGKKKVKPPKMWKPPDHAPENRASVKSAERLEEDERDDIRHLQDLRNKDHAAFKKNWR